MNEIENASANFLDQYSDIAFLWEETLDDYFEKFLKTGVDLREEFIAKLRAESGDDVEEEQLEVEIEAFDAMNNKILDGVATRHPSLDEFDEKIIFLTEVKNRINSLPADSNIGWIKVDSKPLIRELQMIINQWIERFSSFLLVNTVRRIENMEKFINGVESGIKTIPEKADSEAEKKLLTVVMTCLRDVGQIGKKTIELVAPMKDTIILLKKHAVEMKEDYLVELENCKTDLLDVADRALGPTKEAILPLQGKEANNVKDKRRQFQLKVINFRRDFTSNLPYHTTDSSPEIIQDAYEKVQDYFSKTVEMENEARELQVLESLFDLQRTNYKELKDCRNELINLKKMWDLIALIDTQFGAWKKQLWEAIDTENLVQLIKKMMDEQTKPVLPANKEIKNYVAFTSLNERVKNMN